jgi:biopolymer transport protein TolR
MSFVNPFRRGKRKKEEAELNLIPMIDIMSVMVAFLLVYSTEVEVVQNAKDVEIPLSSADVRPKETVLVMITRDQIFVQGDLVASIDDVRSSSEPLIESLRAVLARPIVGKDGAALQAALASREITVLADKSLPYEVLRKVMTTCTAASYGKLSLAVLEKEAPASAAIAVAAPA